jgi:hypothetical protein
MRKTNRILLVSVTFKKSYSFFAFYVKIYLNQYLKHTYHNLIRCVMYSHSINTLKYGYCSQDFCYNDFTDYRQELSQQLEAYKVTDDVFQRAVESQCDSIPSVNNIHVIGLFSKCIVCVESFL